MRLLPNKASGDFQRSIVAGKQAAAFNIPSITNLDSIVIVLRASPGTAINCKHHDHHQTPAWRERQERSL